MALTGKPQYPAWQLGTEQCWMSLKRLRAPPSASWDPAGVTEEQKIREGTKKINISETG